VPVHREEVYRRQQRQHPLDFFSVRAEESPLHVECV
jgi:hypothetical protein